MKYWDVELIDDVSNKDLKALDSSVKNQVYKAIRKISQNPLPKNEGGYGEPLGNKFGMNLTGLCRIKLRKPGIRVIYKVIRERDVMKVIVIAARADEEAYRLAAQRINK